MTRHHLRHREPGWRLSLVTNGIGAVISLAVVVIVFTTRFADAWVMLIVMPLFVVMLLRVNHQYEREAHHLEHDVTAAAIAPILRRHVVLVFVDRLDMASARAIQYARTLSPNELRVVHFAVDEERAHTLAAEWARTGLERIPLEIVGVPDRRLIRAAVEAVARELANGETEVSVLLPDRKYKGIWHRVLHDKTADAILEQVSRLPHCNVTTVPFHLDSQGPSVDLASLVNVDATAGATLEGKDDLASMTPLSDRESDVGVLPGHLPIGDARWRRRVKLAGRVRSMRVAPLHDAPTLELVLVDATGGVSVVFLGRRALAGVDVGTRMSVEGTVGIHQRRLALLNPVYELLD